MRSRNGGSVKSNVSFITVHREKMRINVNDGKFADELKEDRSTAAFFGIAGGTAVYGSQARGAL